MRDRQTAQESGMITLVLEVGAILLTVFHAAKQPHTAD